MSQSRGLPGAGRRSRWRLGAAVGTVLGLAGPVACSQRGDPADPSEPPIDEATLSDAGAEALNATACPEGGYPQCPSPPPSWVSQVQPIVNSSCSPCHFNGGVGTGKGYDFSTPAGLRHGLTTALEDLQSCVMPPGDAAALLAVDRETLLEWLVCGAPDD